MTRTVATPWDAVLNGSEHQLLLYFFSLSCLALLAGFLWAFTTRGEVGVRYRGASGARLGVLAVASISYLFMTLMFLMGYDRRPEGWVPNELAINSFAPRYSGWSISVPLLCVELLAVCALMGVEARRTRSLLVASTFLMIFAGFLGAIIVDGGRNPASTLAWFAVSAVFWVITSLLLLRTVRRSRPSLTPEAGRLLTSAVIILVGGWAVYPIIALIQVAGFGGAWTTTMQVAFCVVDVGVKIGFVSLIHRVAKLRTAEDVRAGEDLHPEAIWISSIKQSDAGQPAEVFLDQSHRVHSPRYRPPAGSARGLSASEAQAAAGRDAADA